MRETRFAVRSLVRRPLASAIIVVTLGLGIGATTAIYSVIQGVLLDTLPYPESDRLALVLESNVEAGLPLFTLSALNYRDFRDRNRSFERLALAQTVSLHLVGEDEPERLFGLAVTGEFFDALRLAPVLGRTIQAADDRPGAAKVVVLGHALWQRRFGGDRGVIGRVVDLSGEPYEVVGVLPPASYPLPREFFVPLALDYDASNRGMHAYVGLGRLADGVTLEGAQADLDAIAASLAETYPDTNAGWGAVTESWQERIVSEVRPALLLLLATVIAVLAIAAVNAVNLMLARLAGREREIAVRAALGASRGQLVRGFLLESVLLTLAAGTLGLLLAAQGVEALLALYAGDLPITARVGVDWRVLLFALAVSLLIGLGVGLLPALRASTPDLRSALAEGGGGGIGGRRGRRVRNGLVLVEVALSVVLLVGAGLLIRSFNRLAAIDPGFDAGGVLTAQVELPPWRYGDEEPRRSFYRGLLSRLDGLPGVEKAALTSTLPMSPRVMAWTFYVDGRPHPAPGEMQALQYAAVSAGYFDALGIPLRSGREFAPTDEAGGQRVVVISESAAARHWPDEEPLGQRIHLGFLPDEPPVWWTVVGVVGDLRPADPTSPIQPTAYTPLLQTPQPAAALALRSAGDPTALAGGLRAALSELDPSLPLFEVQTLEAIVGATRAGARFQAALVGAFAALALILAAIGVYGVVSYGVEQRRRELAVRQAFGADGAKILGLVVRQGMAPVVAGFAVGAVASVWALRLMRGLLYGVGAADPLTWLGAMVLLGGIGLLACLIPARRAVTIDPWSVLREE